MVGLFKKKIKIKDYCQKKYDFIFSSNGQKIMDELLSQSNIQLEKPQSEKYRDHFIAVYIELVGISFSRTISRDLRVQALLFTKSYLEEKKASHIGKIGCVYNSAFGSSYSDGVKPMSEIFAKETTGDQTIFYDAFYGIIEALMVDIKAIKLIQ